MKYLKEEFMCINSVEEQYEETVRKAYDEYLVEYNKTRKLLPTKFLNIYEKNEYFHDAQVPKIGLLTEYVGFSKKVKKYSGSKLKLIILRAYKNMGWEIEITNIKQIEIKCPPIYRPIFIGTFNYDELLMQDEGHISWEIHFSSEQNIIVIFKRMKIRELTITEVSKYKE